MQSLSSIFYSIVARSNVGEYSEDDISIGVWLIIWLIEMEIIINSAVSENRILTKIR